MVPKSLIWSSLEMIPGMSPIPSPFESLKDAGQTWYTTAFSHHVPLEAVIA